MPDIDTAQNWQVRTIDPRDRDRDGVHDDLQDIAVARDTSGPTTDQVITRSEEDLRVGTTRRERGRVRLRKYVTTDANLDAAISGPDISEEEHEVTLHEETPVVEKRVVPRERVRLDTDTVTKQRQVGEEVRKEQLEVEGDQDQFRQDQR